MNINLESSDSFQERHIGPSPEEIELMIEKVGVDSVDQLIDQTIPADIRLKSLPKIPKGLSENQYLTHIRKIADQNKAFTSLIGLGYYNTITPAAIRRNIFENPGWYTQYTPYQAEIAQGRLEALFIFQTMVSDLTGLPIANASLLDEGTAAAEAMLMFFHYRNKRNVEASKFFVSEDCLPQTIDVLQSRAIPTGIELVIGNHSEVQLDESFFGILLQYPSKNGALMDYKSFIQKAAELNIYSTVASDLLSLCLLTPPGEFGADCVVGNSQRFGVPMGFGGPHAAFFSTKDDFKRLIPGRIIGLSKDRLENPAYRMALQTREQHIRREKATSNICTAQALLAIIAGMYAVYHGPDGLKNIALRIHKLSRILATELTQLGYKRINDYFFDTITIKIDDKNIIEKINKSALENQINFWYEENSVSISIDETIMPEDIKKILSIFATVSNNNYSDEQFNSTSSKIEINWPEQFVRKSNYLQDNVFQAYHSETELMRFIKSLENKDLSLMHSMIPLGSCTMKLNSAVELEPVSWPEFANVHPFVPKNQVPGYMTMIYELEEYLNEITGFDATSLQPNSGAQGEYAGLMVIRAYQKSNNEGHRDIILIPSSAHGTNPASAVMAGGKVVVVECDKFGNIQIEDLQSKAEKHKDNLSALMITYPSTHGVFEHHIKNICSIIHENGGQVYMDGANMNAQVGLTNPAIIGADVCHLNLHKTFSIPHGGGGPGVGPICVAKHLTPFLPGHIFSDKNSETSIPAISAAEFGSSSILLISYAYVKLLGQKGITESSKIAILNANYIKARLENHYNVLYVGKDHNRVAHELILDLRMFKHHGNIEVEDIAKRLIDYGFHAPTMSWPVPGTMMIEPTESESKEELDRFCDAMIEIRKEITVIENGEADPADNPLKNAPHTVLEVTSDNWNHKYSRQRAAFPLAYIKNNKFWPSVARVDNSYGDRNLICTCPTVEEYRELTEIQL